MKWLKKNGILKATATHTRRFSYKICQSCQMYVNVEYELGTPATFTRSSPLFVLCYTGCINLTCQSKLSYFLQLLYRYKNVSLEEYFSLLQWGLNILIIIFKVVS